MGLLDDTLAAIEPLDRDAMRQARERHDQLVKPRGSLGQLEDLAEQLAGLARTSPPPIPERAAVVIFAGDHGVHRHGVSPWPQEITAAMVGTFLNGRAVINAIAKQTGATVRVVDVGVATDLPDHPRLRKERVRPGTDDLATAPAMTRAEAVQAVEVGIRTASELVAAGHSCLLTGDMGIANTTPAAALVAAFTGASPEDATGRGTGIDDPTWTTKVAVVRQALDLHRLDLADPLGVLAALGGLEHAATVGYLLGAAALRTPVILDGVAAAAAAIVAAALAPDATGAFIAGHLSQEPAAQLALDKLALRPLLDLRMRLGEGTGASLALPIVQSAARVLHEVATLDELANPTPQGRRVLILGGARSGKSVTAERFLEDEPSVTYVATGAVPDLDDPEWAERVAVHRARRPTTWQTHETRDVAALLTQPAAEPLLIDCFTTWLAGELDAAGSWTDHPDDDALQARVDSAISAWTGTTRYVVAVSNEVGSGIVPATPSGRRFRDELGALNARLAAAADEVWFVTAGIPQRLR
ncbi:nicotinate-nucleotide--dimethylbenzimidazole phosphoribosyltransferase [Tenggerimyces flavus]|uniref:Nicotinate-nucleotide--dimethylbenzimidazole phosphoribosyltransferase n=1 Tax=Tenggerimyces flavus TaxID=1708749 RepID=A0ABV7YRT4_9ACTN|nr:nicotinate-nucleotide--dimethylbenzimidazole phosphoribosyltransferase [Tenggerimyces flavus]MBM7784432.1 nicotinate-nucleotide--dimethylbenzimidazole phosphoribosyltransferase [Tenggerimyces flavus]